jgi:hypothetical protein
MAASPSSLLLPLCLAELVFGLLYALLIHWIALHGWLKGNTAWSVVIGNSATLLIQWLFIPSSGPWLTFMCFAFSGAPMAVTYLLRHQMRVEKAKHTKRPWPTAALRARDNAVMDIAGVIKDIEEAANCNQVNAGFLLTVSNRLHFVKKTLTSV